MDDATTRSLAAGDRLGDMRPEGARWPGMADALGQSLLGTLPAPAGISGAGMGGHGRPADPASLRKGRPPQRSGAGVRGLYDPVKAVFDGLAAGLGLILLSPLFVMVAALVWLRDPGPVFYGHVRLGRGGRSFRCLKFRTMVRDGDALLAAHLRSDPDAAREWEATRKLRDDPRVTPVGRVLRKTSLDELPQLLNVLKGDMSLVGPRPIVADEVHHYGPVIRDYMAVRPGLTGLWQVGGRSDTSYAERVRLDQAYVQRRGFGLDLVILLRTVAVVLKGRGSY